MTGRLPRHLITLTALIGVLLVAALLSACGSSTPSLDSVKIERAIATSILKEHHLHTAVACPSKVPQRSGHVFTCTARLDVGAYPVTVTEIDGTGQVRYQDNRPLVVLNIAKVEQAIEASVLDQRHLRATASCPAEVLQRAGLVFRCTAMIDGTARRYPFMVSEVDNAGHVRYVGT
jgi:hypothetical protein